LSETPKPQREGRSQIKYRAKKRWELLNRAGVAGTKSGPDEMPENCRRHILKRKTGNRGSLGKKKSRRKQPRAKEEGHDLRGNGYGRRYNQKLEYAKTNCYTTRVMKKGGGEGGKSKWGRCPGLGYGGHFDVKWSIEKRVMESSEEQMGGALWGRGEV